jgi:hypothetical protein
LRQIVQPLHPGAPPQGLPLVPGEIRQPGKDKICGRGNIFVEFDLHSTQPFRRYRS